MLLIEMKEITPELVAKALTEEGLEVKIDEDEDLVIKSDQLMIAKIYKEKKMLKYFGSIPVDREKSTKEERTAFVNKMNNSRYLLGLTLFEHSDRTSIYFETCMPLRGWVSSDFLSGLYWEAANEVKKLQGYILYIPEIVEKE